MGGRYDRMRLRRVSWILFLVAALFCLGVGPATASGVGGTGNTYYVDIVNGDDGTGDGSEINPWKTLHHTFGQLESGDILYIQSGEYSTANGEDDSALTLWTSNVWIIGNGNSGDVIIDGAGASNWYSGIRLYASDFFVSGIVIENIDIRNFPSYAGYWDTGNGILVEGGDDNNVTIRNCRIYQNAQSGIYLNGRRHWVEGCEIFDNGAVGVPGSGIFMQAERSVISGNTVYWSGDAGYPQGVGIDVAVADGNQVGANEVYGHTTGSIPCGIQVMGYGTARIFDNRIHGNTMGVRIYDTSPHVFRNLLKDNTTGLSIEYYYLLNSPRIMNNLILGATVAPSTTSIGIDVNASGMEAPAVLIYHNTIYGAADIAIKSNIFGDANFFAPEIFYNIISNTTWGYGIFQAAGSKDPVIDYNLFYANNFGNYQIDTVPGTLSSTNLTGQDPLFVDAPNGNCRLDPDSPAIDAVAPADHNGAVNEDFDRVSRPQNNYRASSEGYDMGCFEAFGFYDPTKTWTQTINSNWSEAGNWDPVGVPEIDDRILIPAGFEVLVDAGATATVLSLENHGTLNIPSGQTLTVEGEGSFMANAPTGTLKGEGTLSASVHFTSVNYGTLAPGASAGTFTITGDHQTDNSGRIAMEIGGTAPASHDKVIINGQWTGGGDLFVTLINDYMPQIGDTFEILNFTSLTAFFPRVHLPPLPLDRIWRHIITGTAYTLEVIAANAGGSGTSCDPYLIATTDHLDHVRKIPDKHFRQVADIDLTAYSVGPGWFPIGQDMDYPFTGSFDGNGFAISNLYINRPEEENIGLFGVVENEGALNHITLQNFSVTGYSSVGALAGYNRGRITHCTAIPSGATPSNDVTGTADFSTMAGGLVGYNTGTLERCRAEAQVVGVHADSQNIGGLAGMSSYGVISQCYATGPVSGKDYIGGLVGYFYSYGSHHGIMNSHASGAVNGTDGVGGLAGYVYDAAVINCYAVGSVTGSVNTGGLIGDGYNSTITNSYFNEAQPNNGYGTPKSTGDMQGDPSIDIYANWYPFVWDFEPTDAYPVLCWTGWNTSSGWAHPVSLDDTVNADPWPREPVVPHAAIGDNGDGVIVWVEGVAAFGTVYMREYRTATGWGSIEALNANVYTGTPRAAVDANGDAAVVWAQLEGGFDRIYRYEHRSGSWDVPAAVSPDGTNAGAPHAAMDNIGNTVIVWKQYDNVAGVDRIYRYEYRSGSWAGPTVVSSDASNANAPRVAMDNNGNAVIVWEQAGDGIYMAEYRSPGPDWNAPERISPLGGNTESPQAAMSDNGDIVIAWRQENNANIYQIFRSDYRLGAWTHPADRNDHISPADGHAEAPHAAMDAGGNAIIVWSQPVPPSYGKRLYISEYRSGAWLDPAVVGDYVSPVGLNALNYHAAMDADGNAVIVWHVSDDYTEKSWISKMEYRDGLWNHPEDVGCGGRQSYGGMPSPRVAMAGNGDAVMAWDLYLGYDPDTLEDVWRVYKSEYRSGSGPDQYILTVDIYPAGEGTVVSNPPGIDCPATACSAPFDAGTDVDLTAAPSGTMTFAYWLVDGQPDRITDNPLTVNMNAARAAAAVFSPFAGGIGTSGDPFQIETVDHLDAVRDYSDSHFILNNSLDLAMIARDPIGTSAAPFTGVFDGNCHLIRHIYIDLPGSDHVGLFGYLGEGSEIRNLALIDVDLVGRDAVGALAGRNHGGQISQCLAAGVVTGVGSDAGGGVGGLVGENAPDISDGLISDSYTAVRVTGSGDYTGGLAGRNYGSIINCYATAQVTGVGGFVGGLIGRNENVSGVESSYWNTETTGRLFSDGGVGLTSTEMRQQSTFTPEWDLATIWNIDDTVAFPYLRCHNQIVFNLDYTAGPNGAIVGDTPQTNIPHGQDGTPVTADPFSGYVFESWSDGVTANPRTDTAVNHVDVTASFAEALAPGAYWVDPGAAGPGQGTESEPWQSLHDAIRRINDGLTGSYTLHLAAGTYQAGTGGTQEDEPLVITQDEVAIIGSGAAATILNGAGAAYWSRGVEIDGASGVVVRNLSIENFNGHGIYMNGAVNSLVEACHIFANNDSGIFIESTLGLVVDACRIYENLANGIYIGGGSGNRIQNNCEIFNNEYHGISIYDSAANDIINNRGSIYDNGNPSLGGAGIWIDGAGSINNRIESNDIYATGTGDYLQEFGVRIAHAGSGNAVIGNTIYGHQATGGFDGFGIEVVNCSPDIMKNVLHDNTEAVVVLADDGGTGSPRIWNNLIYGDLALSTMRVGIMLEIEYDAGYSGDLGTLAPQIYHNTIDGAEAAGIEIDVDAYGGEGQPRIEYNIISNIGAGGWGIGKTSGFNDPVVVRNNFWSSGDGYYQGFISPPTDDPLADNNQYEQDPLYVDAPGGIYRLQIAPVASPCIDYSTEPASPEVTDDIDGVARPQGDGYDIGCYESTIYTVSFISGSGGSIIGEMIQMVAAGGSTSPVTASPLSGYEFTGWSGDYAGMTNPLVIENVMSNMTIYANFAPVGTMTRTVQFVAGAGGAISGNISQTVDYGGSTSPVTAIPNTGYEFIGWTGGYNGMANPLTLTNVTSNMVVTANFRQIPVEVTHTVNFIAGAGGTVSGEETQIVAQDGSTSPVEAIPDEGYEFVEWTGDYNSTANPLVISGVTADMTIIAVFMKKTYAVESSAEAGGDISGIPAEPVPHGESITLTAVPQEGYEFVGWSGDYTGTENPLTLNNVTSDLTVFANFKLKVYTVLFAAGAGGSITGDLSQTVEHGQSTIAVTAVAHPGHSFTGWSGDYSGTANPLTIAGVISDMAVTALFAINPDNQPPAKPALLSPVGGVVMPPGPVTLRSGPFFDPEGDAHVATGWRVGIYGSGDVVYDIRSGSNLTSHTVPGLASGVKYEWRAGYQDAGSGEYVWSDVESFLVGAPTVDENIPPVDPGTGIGDYRMVSFASWPVPSSAEAVFGRLLPEGYDPAMLRIGTYDPVPGGYREYPDFSVEPGRSYWFLAREGLDLRVEGIPVSTAVDFCLGLRFNPSSNDGWNMIAPPNARNYNFGDLMVTATDGDKVSMPVALLPENNPYLDVRVWSWTAGEYVATDDPGFVLEAYSGYWVRVKQAGVTLCFPADAPMAMRSVNGDDASASLWVQLAAWLTGILPDADTAHADGHYDKPPMPMGGLEGAGGSVGCFIEAVMPR